MNVPMPNLVCLSAREKQQNPAGFVSELARTSHASHTCVTLIRTSVPPCLVTMSPEFHPPKLQYTLVHCSQIYHLRWNMLWHLSLYLTLNHPGLEEQRVTNSGIRRTRISNLMCNGYTRKSYCFSDTRILDT